MNLLDSNLSIAYPQHIYTPSELVLIDMALIVNIQNYSLRKLQANLEDLCLFLVINRLSFSPF